MAVVLHVVNGSGVLDAYEAALRERAAFAIGRAQALLPLDRLDIVIGVNPWGAIPEVGIGGSSPGGHIMYLSVDPGTSALNAHLEEELPPTLGHEWHHCARWRDPGYGQGLLGALVSEGLAMHFEREFRETPPLYATGVVGAELARLYVLARRELEAATYDHGAWFFGSAARGLPRWAGYALAYDLVGRGLAGLGQTAAQLAHAPARLFLRYWA